MAGEVAVHVSISLTLLAWVIQLEENTNISEPIEIFCSLVTKIKKHEKFSDQPSILSFTFDKNDKHRPIKEFSKDIRVRWCTSYDGLSIT